MRDYVPAKELAAMLSMTSEGLWLRAKREGWAWRFASASRGRPTREYHVLGLPKDIRGKVLVEAFKAVPPALPAPAAASASPAAVHTLPARAGARSAPAVPAPGALAPAPAQLPATPPSTRAQDIASLHGWQTERTRARAALLQMVSQARSGLGVSLEGAVESINRTLGETGNAHLAELVLRANDRPRRDAAPRLAISTVKHWIAAHRDGGWAALAPKPTRRESIAAWVPALLQINANPAKLNTRHMHRLLIERLQAEGFDGELPTYRQINHFLGKKLGKVAREVGRRGPRDLANIKPHKRRLPPEWPDDVYAADGHKFDALVQHWDERQRALRPEITSVISAATKKIVGIHFGEAENTYGVLAAQRMAFMKAGVPAKWYVDNGPGFKNDAQHHEVLGLSTRLHFEITHSIPDRPQGHGVIERSHKTLFITCAKELPSYIGKDMDKEAAARVYRLQAGRAKRLRGGLVLPTWDQMIGFVLRRIEEYHDRPHTGLPKVVWPDGVKRHQSPNMAEAAARAKGWEPTLLSREEARELFMPQERRTVERGKVRLAGKTYFHAALEEYHGEHVRVGYDWVDPQTVVVREYESQRWICDAELDGNAQAFFPESQMERARRLRNEGRLRRLQDKVDRLDDELRDGRAIEHAPGVAATFIEDFKPSAEPVAVERPVFQFMGDRYEWLMAHRDQWREDDLPWVRRFTQGDDYRLLAERWEMLGITWKEDDGQAPFRAAQ